MAKCFLSLAPTAWGTFILVLKFFPMAQPFPFIRAIGTVQIFLLEFSKDGSADLGDDGCAAYQPVVLQGGVGFSSDQVTQGYGQFQWLHKMGD